jgi:hypothetical protein
MSVSIALADALAAHAADLEPRPTFDTHVLPILKTHCLKCHGPIKPKGALNLAGARPLARGGKSGPAVLVGKPDESALWEQVASGEMPPEPEERLSEADKSAIRRWIEQGATGLPAAAEVAQSAPAADHWAFAPSRRPPPPAVRDPRRIRTSVDRFIQHELEIRGLTLGPDADSATLVRRLTLDLTGVPPSPHETEAFVNDPSPIAYERLVERLIASPRYGERWGKYWLDASGYADSNGYFAADTDRPLAYRYRDYVIRAFNADRPLDQIIREQLAGDEIVKLQTGPGTPPAVIDQLVATHFLRNGQDGTGESDGNPDEVRVDKYAVLDGATQIIGSSLLGLTLQCSKCHDHKFEPVTQKEYYQLQAILYPAFNLEHWQLPSGRFTVAGPRDELLKWQIADKTIEAQLAALRRTYDPDPVPDKKPQKAAQAKPKRDPKKLEAIKPLLDALEARRRPNPGRVAWVSDVSAEPAQIPLLIRGELTNPGPKVGPGVPAFLSDKGDRYEPTPVQPGTPSTGRRLALANWLTRPGSRPSALLARVLANRIWQHHFAVGLTSSTDNLGYTGAPPSHPELLDDLATELASTGWSTKALHRLIVRSTVYRQPSTAAPEVHRADPDNRWLARYPLHRLDAEAIRDAMLAATGELTDQPGGPYVPTSQDASGAVTVNEALPGALRRSVYLQQRRTQITSLLEVFDAPSIVTTCTRRLPSTIPLQSLSLLNSQFVVTRARKLAERIDREARTPKLASESDRVTWTFERVINRPPTALEREFAHRFLADQPARYTGVSEPEARQHAWADFCQMLLASNAFLYVE